MATTAGNPVGGEESTSTVDRLPDEAEGGISQPDANQKALLNVVFRSLKRTHDLFASDYAKFPDPDDNSMNVIKSVKKKSEYGQVIKAVEESKRRKEQEMMALPSTQPSFGKGTVLSASSGQLAITDGTGKLVQQQGGNQSGKLLPVLPVGQGPKAEENTTRALLPSKAPMMIKPKWHAPWKLYRVISGHTGWVRAVDVEPNNEWFASGGADRIIKIWDLAKGTLRLSLTGHISAVRAVKISNRHPFLFSGGEDKQVKCWDLEYNKVIRHYHGHLSAVQALSVHPTLDVLVTCSRDSTARVWDMRTKAQVHCFAGHTSTVADVITQSSDPQVITASHDSTIRLWDLATGRSITTLTHHKKSVRALALHPRLFMFASASPDNIKQWKCPNGEFMQNLPGHNAIVNSLVCNEDGVLVSGGDNGSMCFWDWRSGFCFQRIQAKAQPGSIDSEAGIYAMCYDKTGLRLITAEADKTIKMYKEDDEAMANRTTKDARTVKGTNPQFLVEKIIRQRIYDSIFWKEECFALTAELVVDKAADLRFIGGIYAGNVKPTPFLCLALKMLQIQPEKEIILEFIQQEEFKYVRALGAMYLRLTFSSVEIYKYLEPLYNDYRKLRYMNTMGRFELVHMDELIDHLLRDERYCDIQLPRLQKREALEEVDELQPYKSILDDDLDAMSASSDSDDDKDKKKERPRLTKRRSRSRSKEREHRKERERERERSRRERERAEGGGGRDKDKERDRESRRDDRGDKERHKDKEDRGRSDKDKKKSANSNDDEEREIAEANALRAKLGLAPLQR
ncbi:hypothetical protein WR25_05380 [Diploscapter pachys]|uniref:Pleiotropic regulator 1 n=1 Tax=Diploscapter pachys TaxID=2018661 RepID=A0A2A2K9Y8_9BILA|nr:hypothetical protein WR25_05380 [Diploscapter pachys]